MTRVLVACVDVAVVVVVLLGTWVSWAVVRFLFSPTTFSWPAPNIVVVVVVFDALAFVYLTSAWATAGRTYGAALLGVRVVSRRGLLMRWSGAALRSAFCVAFPLGLLWVAVSRTNRSLQDVVLRTSVVYDWAVGRPEADATAS